MQYSNATILSAVINEWAKPIISQVTQMLAADKIQSFPFIGAIENKVKSWGIVSPNYSIVNEVPGLIAPISDSIIVPTIHKYISQVDDAFIPQMVHEMVDKFIEQGGTTVLERIKIEKEDFTNLKELLNFNLPLSGASEGYVVKTAETINI